MLTETRAHTKGNVEHSMQPTLRPTTFTGARKSEWRSIERHYTLRNPKTSADRYSYLLVQKGLEEHETLKLETNSDRLEELWNPVNALFECISKTPLPEHKKLLFLRKLTVMAVYGDRVNENIGSFLKCLGTWSQYIAGQNYALDPPEIHPECVLEDRLEYLNGSVVGGLAMPNTRYPSIPWLEMIVGLQRHESTELLASSVSIGRSAQAPDDDSPIADKAEAKFFANLTTARPLSAKEIRCVEHVTKKFLANYESQIQKEQETHWSITGKSCYDFTVSDGGKGGHRDDIKEFMMSEFPKSWIGLEIFDLNGRSAGIVQEGPMSHWIYPNDIGLESGIDARIGRLGMAWAIYQGQLTGGLESNSVLGFFLHEAQWVIYGSQGRHTAVPEGGNKVRFVTMVEFWNVLLQYIPVKVLFNSLKDPRLGLHIDAYALYKLVAGRKGALPAWADCTDLSTATDGISRDFVMAVCRVLKSISKNRAFQLGIDCGSSDRFLDDMVGDHLCGILMGEPLAKIILTIFTLCGSEMSSALDEARPFVPSIGNWATQYEEHKEIILDTILADDRHYKYPLELMCGDDDISFENGTSRACFRRIVIAGLLKADLSPGKDLFSDNLGIFAEQYVVKLPDGKWKYVDTLPWRLFTHSGKAGTKSDPLISKGSLISRRLAYISYEEGDAFESERIERIVDSLMRTNRPYHRLQSEEGIPWGLPSAFGGCDHPMVHRASYVYNETDKDDFRRRRWFFENADVKAICRRSLKEIFEENDHVEEVDVAERILDESVCIPFTGVDSQAGAYECFDPSEVREYFFRNRTECDGFMGRVSGAKVGFRDYFMFLTKLGLTTMKYGIQDNLKRKNMGGFLLEKREPSCTTLQTVKRSFKNEKFFNDLPLSTGEPFQTAAEFGLWVRTLSEKKDGPLFSKSFFKTMVSGLDVPNFGFQINGSCGFGVEVPP
jgi:hypothetical protein